MVPAYEALCDDGLILSVVLLAWIYRARVQPVSDATAEHNQLCFPQDCVSSYLFSFPELLSFSSGLLCGGYSAAYTLHFLWHCIDNICLYPDTHCFEAECYWGEVIETLCDKNFPSGSFDCYGEAFLRN